MASRSSTLYHPFHNSLPLQKKILQAKCMVRFCWKFDMINLTAFQRDWPSQKILFSLKQKLLRFFWTPHHWACAAPLYAVVVKYGFLSVLAKYMIVLLIVTPIFAYALFHRGGQSLWGHCCQMQPSQIFLLGQSFPNVVKFTISKFHKYLSTRLACRIFFLKW